MKVYISGKISGIETEAVQLFANAEKLLKMEGHSVVNPMQLLHMHDKSWASYMKEDIRAMCECDAIYMLSNWRDSKGAIIEHTLAVNLGMIIIYDIDDIIKAFHENFRKSYKRAQINNNWQKHLNK